MTNITLSDLRHSYDSSPSSDSEWALKSVDLEWEDGGAYALLGPSGCGKTTLLNIISGLLVPSHGRVLFGSEDVTTMTPMDRRIAQVFQFPVVYDTMSVYDNLAFPLRNRGVDEATVDERVRSVAAMTDLTSMLTRRASGLTADSKQKISLGRGLVRLDVNAVLFDEPLTVIDPHLKFQLRSKLKELHRDVSSTMIYVTHDQTEALTFADKVVVMNMGEIVQIGTPKELFDCPEHTFVGHFIGSPGMNVIPCRIDNGGAYIGEHKIATSNTVGSDNSDRMEIGVRPEFVKFDSSGIPARVTRVCDIGRSRIIDIDCLGYNTKMLVDEGEDVPSDDVRVSFLADATRIYSNGRLCGVE